MNIYQKMFAYVVAVVTLGAVLFNTFATFSPIVLELASSYSFLSKFVMISCFLALAIPMFKIFQNKENT